MAVHKAEQILAKFQQILKDSPEVTVVDASIVRDRVDPAKNTPDISVNMGPDQKIEGSDNNMSFMDSWLDVDVQISVKNNTGLSTELNDVRQKIHKAIYADATLGLNFIERGLYVGSGQIVTSGSVEQEVAEQTINYQFKYRHSMVDPGA